VIINAKAAALPMDHLSNGTTAKDQIIRHKAAVRLQVQVEHVVDQVS
jgi:hypothetical protein